MFKNFLYVISNFLYVIAKDIYDCDLWICCHVKLLGFELCKHFCLCSFVGHFLCLCLCFLRHFQISMSITSFGRSIQNSLSKRGFPSYCLLKQIISCFLLTTAYSCSWYSVLTSSSSVDRLVWHKLHKECFSLFSGTLGTIPKMY